MNLKSIPLLFILTQILWAGNIKTKNIILITLDGIRWENLFTGADEDLYQIKIM